MLKHSVRKGKKTKTTAGLGEGRGVLLKSQAEKLLDHPRTPDLKNAKRCAQKNGNREKGRGLRAKTEGGGRIKVQRKRRQRMHLRKYKDGVFEPAEKGNGRGELARHGKGKRY